MAVMGYRRLAPVVHGTTRAAGPIRLALVATLLAGTLAGYSLTRAGQPSRSAQSQAADADLIVVDPSRVVRTIPPTFFGINYVGFWDRAQGSAASASALAQTPIKTVRFPGGVVADWYDWQDPYYKGWSSTSPADLWRYARSFGATQAIFGTNYQGHLPNPPGKPYAVNSPENAAAWVAYDKQAGLKAAMEVGNEEDLATLHRADDPAYAPYIAAFSAQAAAMHRTDPGVQVLGPAGVNEYYWWALDGLGMFLRGAGNRTGSGQVDGVSLHYYAGSTWYDSRGAAQQWLCAKGPWAAIQAMIHAHDTRNLPVYLTEWNLGASDSHNSFTPTLGHALTTADMIGAFALSGVAGEDYFDIHGASGWGLLYGEGEDRPVDSPTPTYYAMALWGGMGNHLLSLAQSDDPESVVSAYATKRDDGSIQLLAINKRRTPRAITLALDGARAAGHRLRVYSLGPATGSVDDLDARYDGQMMPSPLHPLPAPLDLGIVRGATIQYTVPGYTAVVLDLAGTTPARA